MTPAYQITAYNTFIGLDTDKKSFSFTVSSVGQKYRSKKIPSKAEDFYHYIVKHHDPTKVICAYEAGPTGFSLYDFLQKAGIKCLVTAPASIPKAPNERVKTNRIDSVKLTDHLMSGKLKAIRVPEGPFRELRDLVKTRGEYAQGRKAAKQRIQALLLYHNLYPQLEDEHIAWTAKDLRRLRELDCTPAVRQRLDMLLNDLEYARKNLVTIHRSLKTFCQDHDEIAEYAGYLQSIPGIGFTIAITLLGKIGDPEQLQNPRELAAFVGLTPKERSTGDSVHRGSITRLGDKTLRFLLVEAAWVAIQHNTQLKQFYERIRAKNHPKVASKIAITAVARKMTQIIYRVLKDKREFVQYQ